MSRPQRPHRARPDLPLDHVAPAGLDDTTTDEATGLGRISHDAMAQALAVIAAVQELPADHADALILRRATAKIFKAHKVDRRTSAREAVKAADQAVLEATATGSPQRIDDETAGIPLVSSAAGASAGEYQIPRPCYICKQDYTTVDAFYHQLCPDCAAFNHAKRNARTDLTGRRALLTGGRAKIGMYIALRLLRDGAHTTITTRFPHDAVRRFAACEDSADWIHRLKVVGIDLRDPAQVVGLATSVGSAGHLDILINNAAQTVRRSPGAYSALTAGESQPLHPALLDSGIELLAFDRISDAHPSALAQPLAAQPRPHLESSPGGEVDTLSPSELTRMSLLAGSASLARHEAGTALDAGGLLPDVLHINSWTQVVGEVDALELLEVQLCNQTAPFILLNMLRPALAASPARRTYVVNVSAMEGVFGRGYKGPGHPHTNMSKAALNMMVRTSAGELHDAHGILLTAVDTGWITDERPHHTKIRLAQEGFHAPLDLVDGAARVYDPIVRGEAGEDVYGVFLKDYRPHHW
ncbi:MAG: SDR family NAD(P)-dependent oxidoreductase [Propionibacteriaceae bacterium]